MNPAQVFLSSFFSFQAINAHVIAAGDGAVGEVGGEAGGWGLERGGGGRGWWERQGGGGG